MIKTCYLRITDGDCADHRNGITLILSLRGQTVGTGGAGSERFHKNLSGLPYSKDVRYPFLREARHMLAKKTSKNQVTLPKKILKNIPDTDYFDVSLQEGVVILRPVTVG